MTDGTALRLRLALGTMIAVGEERPATGGVRWFQARLPGATGAPTHRVILCAPPPNGPVPARLLAWVETLRAIDHRGLAEITAAGEFEGRAWLAEPVPPGQTLEARLATRGVLSVRETIGVLRALARVLAMLHRHGVAHGGLAAHAIRLGPRGEVTLANGWAEGSVADDLHALGVVGWTMLTGELPNPDTVHDPARVRHAVPPELWRLVQRLLDRDPAARPERAETVLATLDAFPTPHPSPLSAIFEGAGRGAREAERHPVVLLGVLVAVGMLLLALVRIVR